MARGSSSTRRRGATASHRSTIGQRGASGGLTPIGRGAGATTRTGVVGDGVGIITGAAARRDGAARRHHRDTRRETQRGHPRRDAADRCCRRWREGHHRRAARRDGAARRHHTGTSVGRRTRTTAARCGGQVLSGMARRRPSPARRAAQRHRRGARRETRRARVENATGAGRRGDMEPYSSEHLSSGARRA